MWIVSLVLIGLKYYGAINLDWGTVLIFAVAPVWMPLVFAYFLSHSAPRSARGRKRTTTRRRSTSLF
jgi:hypothetical protein